MPINFYQGPGRLYSTRDVEQRNPFTETLARLTQERRDEQSQQNLAEMAAQRMSALGPQGAYWAEQIKRDPRAALALAGQYGGFAEIENSILGARKAGEAQMQWDASLQGSNLTPIELGILRQAGPAKGPAALKAYRDSQAGPAVKPVQVMTPNGPQWVDARDAIGMRPVEKGGIVVGVDANGNPIVSIGGSGDAVTNATRSKIEAKQVDVQDNLSRVDNIRASFDPSYLQWGTKARMRVLQMKSAAGTPLSQDEESQLGQYAGFRASAFQNLSFVLNQLSGAAISPAEAERLKQFLPDPGTGIFDGDDPVTFKRKLDQFDSELRASIARYAQVKGGALDEVPPPLPSRPTPAVGKGQKPAPIQDKSGNEVEPQWDPEKGDWFYEGDF